MDLRGRSVDPELVLPRQRYSHSSLPRQEKRAQSAAPTSIRLSKFYNDHQADGNGHSTLPKSAERALINQHVNPYQEFPSLRRGFTLQGMSITDKDKNAAVTNIDMMTINEEGDACAYYFWAITLFFFVIALINFFVLVSIVFVLGIGPHGMEAIEFLPDLQSVKFLKDLYASDITIGSGIISGYAGESIKINSTGGEVLFQIDDGFSDKKKPGLRVSPNEIKFENINNFKVRDPSTGELYFDAFAPQLSLDSHTLESLIASEIETNRIVSPIDKDLLIQSDSGLDLEGAEGISVQAKRVEFEAGQNIRINSETGSIILDSESISLGPLGLPLGGEGFTGGEKSQYKVCICSPSGKLFTVPVMIEKRGESGRIISRTSCETIPYNWERHPCEDDD